jgi:hypothetical protein
LVIDSTALPVDATLDRLHAGERAAILLAECTGADIVLLDEKAARTVAVGRGLRVIGLLGVLREAANRGLADLLCLAKIATVALEGADDPRASDPDQGQNPALLPMLAAVLGSLCLLISTRLAVLPTTFSCRHAVATPGRSTATYGDGSEGLLLDGCAP